VVDVNRDTMVMDLDALEAALTPRTKVVMPVSAFGNPVDYHRLNALKSRYGFLVVEDAAPALGARYRGIPVGRLADITVFSLHPRKFITTGEGGLVVTDNSSWADWMNSYKHFGMAVGENGLLPRFERVGTNYKLSDILSAVGLAQMEMIDGLLQRRLDLARQYEEMLRDVPGIQLSHTTEGGLHSRQSFCVFVENRDSVLKRMRGLGIEVQIGTFALHREPAFQPGPNLRWSGDFVGSRRAFHQCLALPLYHAMTSADQEAVVAELKASI